MPSKRLKISESQKKVFRSAIRITPGTEPTTAADTESTLTGIKTLVSGEKTLISIKLANPRKVLCMLALTGDFIPEKAFIQE